MFRRLHPIALGFTVASFALAAAFFDRMPNRVPTHWNVHGVADGFTAKPWGPFVGPLLLLGCYLLFLVLPALSPTGFTMRRFGRYWDILVAATMAVCFVLCNLALFAALGLRFSVERVLCLGLGALFLVFGNYMGKLRRNFFVGIRTPWTLANEEVWNRTHRLGGKLFVAAGLLSLAFGLWHASIIMVLGVTLLAALVPVVYSYLVYRRVTAAQPNHDE